MTTFEIRPKTAVNVIAIVLTLFLMGITAWAIFGKTEDPLELAGPGLIIPAIIVPLGCVVIYFALKAIILRPPVIRIDEQGFEYNPGGVSTGLIPWAHIEDILEVDVRTTRGDQMGPVVETALGIRLKDPETYRNQFNPVIRKLMELNEKMYEVDILFRLSDFGTQVDAMKDSLLGNWRNSRRAPFRPHRRPNPPVKP